ncbi:DUF397 domain-containing protein [Saccharothrix obliqua]|uniref:DUF397 domain-containing protein n=1 Tax=Saccharothrix obliqua TaxID=2861747 RepID=UPI001C5E3A23|nr:DUF397 domain-containing protein [Saccharothrix obliqua]MBW4715711.1 DUF397 domain-containing protein [Saccharothrix obliqua]
MSELGAWRKSSRSAGAGQCVEVARTTAVVGVRDSKAPHAGHLQVPNASFVAFLDAVKR